jgi:hypothetical protein
VETSVIQGGVQSIDMQTATRLVIAKTRRSIGSR